MKLNLFALLATCIFPIQYLFPMVGGDNDPCFILNWDIVNGGRFIRQPIFGECEYEVDIDNPGNSSNLVFEIPQSFEYSREHRVIFKFTGEEFDRLERGHFRIMSLYAGRTANSLAFIDLFWGGHPSGIKGLFLQAKALIEDPLNPGVAQIRNLNVTPYSISGGFGPSVYVDLRLTESSSPGASDGSIELWVDNELIGAVYDQTLDWTNQGAPTGVAFGVVEVVEPDSGGILRIAPVQPSPLSPVF